MERLTQEILICECTASFSHGQRDTVLTPHGAFGVANPESIVAGRLHLLRYHPFDQFAWIVAIYI